MHVVINCMHMDYKQLRIPADMHTKLKERAAYEGKTIIALLDSLLSNASEAPNVATPTQPDGDITYEPEEQKQATIAKLRDAMQVPTAQHADNSIFKEEEYDPTAPVYGRKSPPTADGHPCCKRKTRCQHWEHNDELGFWRNKFTNEEREDYAF